MEMDELMIDEKMKQVYQQEAEIDKLTRETNRLEKDIKHIKNSRRFQMSKIARPFAYFKIFLKVLFKGKKMYKENINLKQELLRKDYLIEQQSTQLKFVDRAVDKLTQADSKCGPPLVKLLNQEGLTFEFINQIIDQDQRQKRQMKEVIDQLTRSHRHVKDQTLQDYLYQKTAILYKSAQFPEYLVRQAEQRKLSLAQLDSFSAQLVRRFRLKQVSTQLPETILDDKKTAYQFIEQLNIPYPEQDDQIYTIETVPQKPAIVIKPTEGDGGRGVYLVKSETDIFDVKRERELSSWPELIKAMTDDIKQNRVSKDQWYIEGLLQLSRDKRARDIKFYCFYGVIGLILEIDRTNRARYWWWDHNGKWTNTGKYQESQFEGLGVSIEEMQQAIDLSLHIPTPFMRIDFIRTDNGLYFGEFTPKPGNFDEFDLETDRMLGQLYLEAEARLNADLINRKDFAYFNNIIKDTRRHV